MNLDHYTETFEYELREFVALWSQPEGGVDRAHGGFCCGLDYSGARLGGFQGPKTVRTIRANNGYALCKRS